MADGGGGTGRILAGCGCLTWLGCVLLVVLVQILMAVDVVPYSLYGVLGFVTPGGSCCASLGFVVGLVGIIMMLMGRGSSSE